jgi:hypothetical protein
MVKVGVEFFRASIDSIYEDKTTFPFSVMVWGAIGHGFTFELVFVDGAHRLDARDCLNVLDNAGASSTCSSDA